MTANEKYYIDNEKFLKALTEYKEKYNVEMAAGRGRPQIPDYIGSCFLKISEGFASRRSFNRYPFKEDMIEDGVFFCVKYIHNFDPAKIKKPTDPFNYFTMFVYHAFLQRIAKEKRYLYVKLKSTQKAEMIGDTYEGTNQAGVSIDVDYSENARIKMNEFLAEFEEKNFTKKKAVAKKK